jgi:hypothetical protein
MVFLEGTASAVPKKNSVVLEHDPPVKAKTIANGEWRVASSEWFFWRARFLPCRKILGTFQVSLRKRLGRN